MTDGLLAGLRVIDAATLAAGPLIATWMGVQGAEVIKVEQPDGGDPLRQWGAQRDSIGLMWKSVARNKKAITLNLRLPAGRDLLRSLTRQADVVIVNLRPSTMRRWDLDYESLAAANPRLVMVHVTGYGADGPKSDWPGFGTLGEAMSGFAHLTGTPDGPPTLPSFMLADGVAALNATYAVMMALYHRDAHGGDGQLIDVNLIEPLARLIETSTLTYTQLDKVPGRVGNRLDASAPRNAYQTADEQWVAISSASPNLVVRVYRAVDRADLAEDPEYVDPVRRRGHALEIDQAVADWIAKRPLDEVMAVFEAAEVAAAPIYDARQLLADEHLRARGSFIQVDDPDFGRATVQGPVVVMSETPGRVDHLGRGLGQDNDAIYGGLLGIDAERLDALRAAGTI